MSKIVIKEYNISWKKSYDKLEKVLSNLLNGLIVSIEHVGSTSVEGLSAKPILDIDIIIDSYDVFPDIVEKLNQVGYFYEGDLGIKGREAFGRKDEFVPYSKEKNIWMDQHLYVCPKYSEELKRHIAFRDYLRKNKDKAYEYGKLKKKLAAQYRSEREKYTEAKTNFITGTINEIFKNKQINK